MRGALRPRRGRNLRPSKVVSRTTCSSHKTGSGRFAVEISGTMRKHQLKLADRQCRMAELSQRVQDSVVILVSALWGNGQGRDAGADAADILCQDLRRKLTGERPSDGYFRDCARLADRIISGEWEDLKNVPRADILMPYENK